MLLPSPLPAVLRDPLMSRESDDGKQEDAGYDSDMSLEAYDLSEGSNSEGESLPITEQQLDVRANGQAGTEPGQSSLL
jgi:hypothetical protein